MRNMPGTFNGLTCAEAHAASRLKPALQLAFLNIRVTLFRGFT